MKKALFLCLIALFGVASAHAKVTRPELVQRVESCEAILREFQSKPQTAIPDHVLQAAKGLIILNQFKAGFLLGLKDGYGVILVKKPDGRWSLPVLINAGEASLGFQVGATTQESVFVINDDQIPRALFRSRFRIGVDAKAVVGPKNAERERFNKELLEAPMFAYTKSVGLFAGATVKAGHISRNDEANFLLYNTRYTMPELLYSDWVTPPNEVMPLMSYVQKITQ